MNQAKTIRKGNDRIERLKNLVIERNAQVIICNNPETYALVELGIELDKAVKRLRNRTFTSISAKDAIPVFEKIGKSLITLESAIRDAAELTDMTFYRTPRTIKRFQQQMEMDQAEDQTSQSENVLKIADSVKSAKNCKL